MCSYIEGLKEDVPPEPYSSLKFMAFRTENIYSKFLWDLLIYQHQKSIYKESYSVQKKKKKNLTCVLQTILYYLPQI